MARPGGRHLTGSAPTWPDAADGTARADRRRTGPWSLVRPAVATVKGGILTLGAVAGAIAAVIALLPSTEPVQIRFTSLSVSPTPVPASEFRPVEDAPLALTGGVDGHRVTVRLAAGAAFPSSTQSITSGPPATEYTSPTTEPTEPTQATESTEPGGPSGPSDLTTSPSTTPSGPSDLTTSPTTEPTDDTSGPGNAGPDLPRGYTTNVIDEVDKVYRVGEPEGPLGALQTLVQGASTDVHGDRVPAKVAAERIIKVLSHVRTRPITQGHGQGSGHGVVKKDPLGVVLRVNVDLIHGKGQPIRVFWEIIDASDGQVQSLSQAWLQDVAAYELVAGTDPDTAYFKLWVPLPEKRGDYVISLTARGSGDALPLAEKTTETVVH